MMWMLSASRRSRWVRLRVILSVLDLLGGRAWRRHHLGGAASLAPEAAQHGFPTKRDTLSCVARLGGHTDPFPFALSLSKGSPSLKRGGRRRALRQAQGEWE